MTLGMRAIIALLSLSCAFALSSDLSNANHIFNSIQSAGKLWGSCVNHNGMTFYLATIPKGTRLFHGDASTDPRTDVVFLAFEPEHALMFARPKGPPRGPHGPGSNLFEHESSDLLEEPLGLLRRFWDRLANFLRPKRTGDSEIPLDSSPEYGWLHTYVTTRDLRLVYVDGLSAAKSNRGTLDSQDLILLNGTVDENRDGHGSDYDRLYTLCDLAESDFQGKIDGMLRLEMAFEVNLCDPLSKLDLVALDAVSRTHEGGHGPGLGASSDIPVFSSRYHGIGGDRVRINFDDFLTVYNFGLELFPNDALLPRLDHFSMSELEPIRSAVKPWILAHGTEQETVDWQAVADMLVTRFGQSLKTISKSNSMDFILKEVHRLLNPFTDFLDQSPEQLLDRCSSQFIPSNTSMLAADAIYTVSHRICSDLAALIDTDTSEQARERVLALIDYLQWPYFKMCEACKGDEFCQIPIWPMGSQKDYDNPQCQKFSNAFADGNDYWKFGNHRPTAHFSH